MFPPSVSAAALVSIVGPLANAVLAVAAWLAMDAAQSVLAAVLWQIAAVSNAVVAGFNLLPGYPLDGGCTCREVRYRMLTPPLFVHCCHCRWCQRESGASFALNAMIEADRVEIPAGVPQLVLTPSNSGKGQKISRCPTCRIAVWSNYAGAGEAIRFVRVGTLDDPDLMAPAAIIWAGSAPAWVELDPKLPQHDKGLDSPVIETYS